MNDIDVINALTDKEPRREMAREFLKSAGIGSSAGAVAAKALSLAAQHKPEIAAALGGALLLGGGQYLMSRPRDGGKRPSHDQESSRSDLAATRAFDASSKKSGKELGYVEGVQRAMGPAKVQIADLNAKHPVQSAIPAASMGALTGLAILKALTKERTWIRCSSWPLPLAMAPRPRSPR